MRPFIFAANWKMHKTPEETRNFVQEFQKSYTPRLEKKVYLFAPHVCLHALKSELENTAISWGAQNCHYENQGAFTGETSPQTLSHMKCHSVILGHSERRALFHETDAFIAKKVKAVQEHGMMPLLCVGEVLEERENNQTETVLEKQIRNGLKEAALDQPLIVAYEPVWAIGTGKVASPEMAEAAHKYIRTLLHELGGANLAQNTPILYGGSVKPDNARDLSHQPNIDGFLVGGASLKPQDFNAIISISKMT